MRIASYEVGTWIRTVFALFALFIRLIGFLIPLNSLSLKKMVSDLHLLLHD